MRFVATLLVSLILLSGSASALSAGEIEADVNNYRAAHGLNTLADNAALDVSAVAKANDLCSKNYWGHYAPDGTAPWYWFYQAGYPTTAALGENLAYGWNGYEVNIFDHWLASPEHLANIVGQYNEQGAAVIVCPSYQDGTNVTIAVNHFGYRYLAPPVVNKPAAPVDVQPQMSTEQPTPPQIAKTGTVKATPHHDSKTDQQKFIDLLLSLIKGYCLQTLWQGAPYKCLTR